MHKGNHGNLLQVHQLRNCERGCLQRVEEKPALKRGATARREVDGRGWQGWVHSDEWVRMLQGQAERVHWVREYLTRCLGRWDVLHDDVLIW